MLSSTNDTDLHRSPLWTELRFFYLKLSVCYFGKPKRVRVDSEGSWMSEAAATFFGKGSVLLEPISGRTHWPTGLVEEAIRGLKTTTTAKALKHTEMGALECRARAVAASSAREDVRGYSPPQNGFGRVPVWTADSAHQNTRHLPQYVPNLRMRPVATTSNGCRTLI